jgi:hypothetical protein
MMSWAHHVNIFVAINFKKKTVQLYKEKGVPASPSQGTSLVICFVHFRTSIGIMVRTGDGYT